VIAFNRKKFDFHSKSFKGGGFALKASLSLAIKKLFMKFFLESELKTLASYTLLGLEIDLEFGCVCYICNKLIDP